MSKFKQSFTPVKKLYHLESDLDAFIGTTQTLKGYVRFKRNQPDVSFVSMYDGSHPTPYQLIFDKSCEDLKTLVDSKLNIGDSISATGVVVKSPAKGQLTEIKVTAFEIIGKIADPLTYKPAFKGVPLDSIRSSHEKFKFKSVQAIMRIRSTAMKIIHDFMHDKGVHHLDPNIVTTSDCEGAGELFVITTMLKDGSTLFIPTLKDKPTQLDFSQDFFKDKAYLTVSSQLQLEAECAGMGACFTTNPSFRAEKSKTKRHLACFTHLEWELPFIGLKDLMDFSEDLVTYIISETLTRCKDDLKELDSFVAKGLIKKLESFIAGDFARISYDEAIEIISKDYKEILALYKDEGVTIPKWGDDLSNPCEKYLAEHVFKRPVFVYNYPFKLKSFYMKQVPKYEYARADGTKEIREVCEGCDLLVPYVGELIGSSTREDDYEKLKDEMLRRDMDLKPLEWYLELRKSATFPHGGAGLGFDRLISILTSATTSNNIRDCVPFPVAFEECYY